MKIWKNTCGESWQGMIENGWEVSGKLGAFLFFIPKGALTHHLLKQAVVSLPLVGHVRSPRGIATPAGALWTIPHHGGAVVIVHAVGGRCCHRFNMPSHESTAFHQLPAQTCHWQLCLWLWVSLAQYPFSFCGKRNKNKERKDGESKWQFTIWKRRSSAVV